MSLSIMEPLSEKTGRRAENLCRIERLVNRLDLAESDRDLASEVCRAFDVAAEFAACEGRSIQAALTEFFADAEPVTTRWGAMQEELRKAVQWGAASRNPLGPLPVMPGAVLKLLNLSDESATVGDLEGVCGSDPVLMAQILSLANSARFGSRFEITRVGEAIQRVGIAEARKALLSACLCGLFASRTLQDLWDHSQQVADVAWLVAGLCGVDRGTAYTAGLLHDIGRLAFLRGPGHLQADEWNWMEAGFPQVYAETLVRGEDHATRGAAILADWGLPAELVEAVRKHHRPEVSRELLVHVLFLAEDLATAQQSRPAEDLWSALRRQVSLERAGISIDALQEAITEMDEPTLRRVC